MEIKGDNSSQILHRTKPVYINWDMNTMTTGYRIMISSMLNIIKIQGLLWNSKT